MFPKIFIHIDHIHIHISRDCEDIVSNLIENVQLKSKNGEKFQEGYLIVLHILRREFEDIFRINGFIIKYLSLHNSAYEHAKIRGNLMEDKTF